MERNLKDIIIEAKSGDKKASEFILEKYNPLIIKRAISYFIKGYDTEDLIQIARVTTLVAIDKYDILSKSNFTAYLDRAIANNFNNMLRNNMKLKYQSSLDISANDGMTIGDLIADEKFTEEIIEKKFMLNQLLIALDELDIYDKELILFLYSENSGNLTKWSKTKGESYAKVRKRRNEILKILKSKVNLRD